jgi:hypothetical protein
MIFPLVSGIVGSVIFGIRRDAANDSGQSPDDRRLTAMNIPPGK